MLCTSAANHEHIQIAKSHTNADKQPAQGERTVPVAAKAAAPGPLIVGSFPTNPKTEEIGRIKVENTVDAAAASLQGLNISTNGRSLVVDGSGMSSTPPSHTLLTGQALKAQSVSDLAQKPPSLDGKSIASGTTFALDEKESLRPDDSASVKAAADDDDASSLLAGSRIGSEAAARSRAGQLSDLRNPHGSQPQGVMTPQSTSSEQPDALNVIYRQAPDEKLLLALSTNRDRYFLLRLEKDVMDFVQNSKEPYMDLPPSNSFCRMLTHKLADYYHMTHSYEPHIGSVRIFRTPFCRVPPSLALMMPPPSTSTSSTPPPAVLPRKIMRRGQEGDGGSRPVSENASKAASEVDSESKDGKDKQPAANAKLSREQREEMYKLARERIFGNSEEASADQDATGSAEMSRASSVSANRSTVSKKSKSAKQRRDDSDSFDSRHQYMPYWGPQQQTWVPHPPGPGQYPAQHPGQGPVYVGPGPAMYGQPPAPPFPGPPPPGQQQMYGPYATPQYPPGGPHQQYQPTGSPMTPYGSPLPAGGHASSWQQPPPFGSPSMPYPAPVPTPSGGRQASIPYAYGQLPANANPHDPKSQHPIPGSYNRNQGFNPMTQSFIPGSNVPSAPQPPFTAPGSHHSSPQIGTPHLAYANYQPGVPMPPYAGAYAMARQGSNSSIPSYHPSQQGTPPHPATPNMPHGPHVPLAHPPAPVPNRPPVPQGPGFSHLPNYGNPASLPQRPATGM